MDCWSPTERPFTDRPGDHISLLIGQCGFYCMKPVEFSQEWGTRIVIVNHVQTASKMGEMFGGSGEEGSKCGPAINCQMTAWLVSA